MKDKPKEVVLQQMEIAFKENQKKGRKEDILILGHFFLISNDWYISEYDSKTETMFGFMISNGYYQFAEWGVVPYQGSSESLMELNKEFIEVSFDNLFRPIMFSDLKKQLDRRFSDAY